MIQPIRLPKKKTIRIQSGVATNDSVFSASMGLNADMFPHILALYVPAGSTVADVTYGTGAFWRNIPRSLYDLRATDIKDGVDCRALPYADASIDAVVLDPPYMHTPGGSAHVGHQNFERYYANNSISNDGKKYHEAVLDLYFKASREALRVLRPKGIFILKCQDEVCANKQRLTHIEIYNELLPMGYLPEDVFVLIRTGKPGVSRMLKQRHARKNHSYFMVFRKKAVRTSSGRR